MIDKMMNWTVAEDIGLRICDLWGLYRQQEIHSERRDEAFWGLALWNNDLDIGFRVVFPVEPLSFFSCTSQALECGHTCPVVPERDFCRKLQYQKLDATPASNSVLAICWRFSLNPSCISGNRKYPCPSIGASSRQGFLWFSLVVLYSDRSIF